MICVKNGIEVSAFETGVSTSYSYAYEDVRLDRMVVELGRRIIAKPQPPGG